MIWEAKWLWPAPGCPAPSTTILPQEVRISWIVLPCPSVPSLPLYCIFPASLPLLTATCLSSIRTTPVQYKHHISVNVDFPIWQLAPCCPSPGLLPSVFILCPIFGLWIPLSCPLWSLHHPRSTYEFAVHSAHPCFWPKLSGKKKCCLNVLIQLFIY